jgi:transposase
MKLLLGEGLLGFRNCSSLGTRASSFGIHQKTIGVDEVKYVQGHHDLTLAYQIDEHCRGLLSVGKERTVETFEGFFTKIGADLSRKIKYVYSDMWHPYWNFIKRR